MNFWRSYTPLRLDSRVDADSRVMWKEINCWSLLWQTTWLLATAASKIESPTLLLVPTASIAIAHSFIIIIIYRKSFRKEVGDIKVILSEALVACTNQEERETRRLTPTPPPPPPDLENHKNIGFLTNTGPDPLRITKLQRQHSMLGHHGHASETPFTWCLLAGPSWPAHSDIWNLFPLIK